MNHSNIVAYYDSTVVSGKNGEQEYYILMEYCGGTSTYTFECNFFQEEVL